VDYLIEIRAWSLGYDEAEELAAAFADVCVERGLGLRENDDDEEIRSLVSLKPQSGRLDSGVPEKAQQVIRHASRGAQLLIVPSKLGSLTDRPTVGL
jgi:hypothetical protein